MKSLLFLVCIFILSACEGQVRNKSQLPEPQGFGLTASDLRSNFCGEAVGPRVEDPLNFLGYDMDELAQSLAGEGLEGHIHAAAHDFRHYVLNYGPTLKAVRLNLVAGSQGLADAFESLSRHDRVIVRGHFIDNPSPIKHIFVRELYVAEPFEGETRVPYEYQTDIQELMSKSKGELFGKVHALLGDGAALILEYGDVVLPVLVDELHREMTKTLYRNDIVRIKIKAFKKHEHQPLHLTTDADWESAVVVADHMANCHDKDRVVSGQLVFFPKSPQINTNVFAIGLKDDNGIERKFTLFPDAKDHGAFGELFAAISKKAQAVWDEHRSTAAHGRGSMQNANIIATAMGRMNIVSPNQANPQIYIKDVNDLSFEVVAE